METRKLSYRKDDRAMRPMYGRPENFQESLTTHTATFPEFLMGFCPIEPINVHAKFEIRSFNRSGDNSGYPTIFWQSPLPGYAHAPFFQKIFMGFYSDGPCECTG